MFEVLWATLYNASNVVTGNRLQLLFNGQVVKEWVFPITTVMTEAQQDAFIAAKLGAVLSSALT